MKLIAALGVYVRLRRNFLRVATLLAGTSASLIGLLLLGQEENLGFAVFMIIVAFGAAYVWSVLMWHLYFKSIYSRYN